MIYRNRWPDNYRETEIGKITKERLEMTQWVSFMNDTWMKTMNDTSFQSIPCDTMWQMAQWVSFQSCANVSKRKAGNVWHWASAWTTTYGTNLYPCSINQTDTRNDIAIREDVTSALPSLTFAINQQRKCYKRKYFVTNLYLT